MKLLDIKEALHEMKAGKVILIIKSMNTARIRRDLSESRIWYCGTFMTQKKFKDMFGPNTKFGRDGFYLYDEWVEEDKKKRPWKYPND